MTWYSLLGKKCVKPNWVIRRCTSTERLLQRNILTFNMYASYNDIEIAGMRRWKRKMADSAVYEKCSDLILMCLGAVILRKNKPISSSCLSRALTDAETVVTFGLMTANHFNSHWRNRYHRHLPDCKGWYADYRSTRSASNVDLLKNSLICIRSLVHAFKQGRWNLILWIGG